MSYMNSIMSYLINIGCLKQSALTEHSANREPIAGDYASLVRQQNGNRLLNTQARIEYALLKSRILAGIFELNKLLELDDQIIVQEYKSCTSMRYRQQFFVMEFKQLPIDDSQCNHALDLVFHGSDRNSEASGKTTLALVRERNQFVWQQLHPVSGGPAGTSKLMAGLVLRWIQNEHSLFMRFAIV